MMRLSSRLRNITLLGLLAMLGAACETTRRGAEEYAAANRSETANGEAASRPSEVSTRQIARLNDLGKMEYTTSQALLARAFIQQFGDGTVIDRVMVRKAPGKGRDASGYFLLGMGLRNGMFRAMAIPLQNGGDNTFSISSATERYILSGVGCSSCTFNFEGPRIVGTTCSDNSGGSRCDLRIEPTNTLFARMPSASSAR